MPKRKYVCKKCKGQLLVREHNSYDYQWKVNPTTGNTKPEPWLKKGNVDRETIEVICATDPKHDTGFSYIHGVEKDKD